MKLFCSLAWQHTLRYRKLNRNTGYILRKLSRLLFSEERANPVTIWRMVNTLTVAEKASFASVCFYFVHSSHVTPASSPPLASERFSLFIFSLLSSNCSYSVATFWLRLLLSAFSLFQVLFLRIFLLFVVDLYSLLRNSIYCRRYKVLSSWNVLKWTTERNVYTYCAQLSDAWDFVNERIQRSLIPKWCHVVLIH